MFQTPHFNSLSTSLNSPMGNRIARQHPNSTGTRVITSDGKVQLYDEPLTVAELMLEYPQEVVLEYNTTNTKKRQAPLSADTKLASDKVYIMLPKKRGNAVSISSVEAQRVLLAANAMLNSKPSFVSCYTGFLPLFVRICPVGNRVVEVQKRNELEEKSQEMWKTGFSDKGLDEREEDCYLSKQLSGKGWKPSLDTIEEKIVKAKVRHWLVN